MTNKNQSKKQIQQSLDEHEYASYDIKNMKRSHKKKVNKFKDKRDYYEYDF